MSKQITSAVTVVTDKTSSSQAELGCEQTCASQAELSGACACASQAEQGSVRICTPRAGLGCVSYIGHKGALQNKQGSCTAFPADLRFPFDIHMHTTYSDGNNTPAEMVEAAYELGLSAVGISDHSHVSFEPGYCMDADARECYQQDVCKLRERYAGRIKVYCGIEQDLFSAPVEEGYDYIIGSVHYVEIPPELADAAGGYLSLDGVHAYVSVDDTEELFCKACEVCFGGDYLAFAEAYYKTLEQVIERTGASIVGHVDLFAKFNKANKYFDEHDERYVRAWRAACDSLLTTGAVFEINYSACISGRRSVPYPSPEIQEYLRQHGAQFISSSDAHSIQALNSVWDSPSTR